MAGVPEADTTTQEECQTIVRLLVERILVGVTTRVVRSCTTSVNRTRIQFFVPPAQAVARIFWLAAAASLMRMTDWRLILNSRARADTAAPSLSRRATSLC